MTFAFNISSNIMKFSPWCKLRIYIQSLKKFLQTMYSKVSKTYKYRKPCLDPVNNADESMHLNIPHSDPRLCRRHCDLRPALRLASVKSSLLEPPSGVEMWQRTSPFVCQVECCPQFLSP